MVAVFHRRFLTDEGAEVLMSFLNMALSLTDRTYRFPSKIENFAYRSKFDARSCSGVYPFTVCKRCHKLFDPSSNVVFCQACNVSLYKNPTAAFPTAYKTYMYNSVINTLKTFFLRKNFVENIKKWTTRDASTGALRDIYDGRVWNEFKLNAGDALPFVKESVYNLMLTINIDWFQPYKGTQYSVGAIYLTIQNLPREVRNLRNNIIFVGLMPGPKEPKTVQINNYLEPFVNDLLELARGVAMNTYSHGVAFVKAALTLVACDIPAARKLCGFTSHSSAHACHKCEMMFNNRDFSNFDMSGWTSRTKASNEHYAQLWFDASTTLERERLEREHGTRWSQLHRLSYFDAVRFTVIDPMHNLYLGTCQKMSMLWRNTVDPATDDFMLTKNHLKEIKEELADIFLPLGYDVKTLLNKLDKGDGFSHFTADEWRVWCLFLSPLALKGRLPPAHMSHWMLFVNANRILANPSISYEDINTTHGLLHEFCSRMAELYNPEDVVVNMHLHMHLKDTLLDYGPTYAYWAFNFERYNGDIKLIRTNRKDAIEVTFTRSFLKAIHFEDYLASCTSSSGPLDVDTIQNLALHRHAGNKVVPLMDRDELVELSEDFDLDQFLNLATFSDTCGIEPMPIQAIESIRSVKVDVSIQSDHYLCLLGYYQNLYGDYFCPYNTLPSEVGNSSIVSNTITTFKSVNILGQKYNSKEATAERGSYIRAIPSFNSTNSFIPGQIQYFFQHKVLLRDDDGATQEMVHTFAFVMWFIPYSQVFPGFQEYDLEVWRNDFMPISCASIVPIHRIYSPVGVMKWLPLENLIVVIPCQRKVVA